MSDTTPSRRAAPYDSAETFAAQLASTYLTATPEETKELADWRHAHDQVLKGMELVRWSGLGAATMLGALCLFVSSSQIRNPLLLIAFFLVLVFLSVSARNLRPECLADRFVPPRVRWFRRWLIAQPSVNYIDLVQADIFVSESKRPLELVLATTSGESYRFSLRRADVLERTIASQILERILHLGVPVRLVLRSGVP